MPPVIIPFIYLLYPPHSPPALSIFPCVPDSTTGGKMEPSHMDIAPMMVDDDDEDDILPAASLAPATTLLREQALGLLSDAQTAERKDKEILLKQVRKNGK